jgi:alanine racemase
MANAKSKSQNNLRTWIEIDSGAARKNHKTFRKLVGPKVKMWAVVKSNAYGHGILVFSHLMDKLGIDGFCVDSLVEGLRLRKEGIKKPILVLGPTLAPLLGEAAEKDIAVTVSSFDALRPLAKTKSVPEFHLKIDTGMHRQGFYPEDLPQVIRFLSHKSSVVSHKLTGLYTHFASAKDINYPTYTEKQFQSFQEAAKIFERAGFRNLTKHCAATGGTLVSSKYHLDAVRLGIGLYGLWPSKELEMQLPKIHLHPVLSWRAVVSEVKDLHAGDYVGYDLVERIEKDGRMAVVPIGYWHGFPRALSGVGEALIRGCRARTLGRVSMDLLVLDVRGIKCKAGDVVTLIGNDGAHDVCAPEQAQKSGTTHYEFLTRLNPLIERVLV